VLSPLLYLVLNVDAVALYGLELKVLVKPAVAA
jgi:hypothetical protein